MGYSLTKERERRGWTQQAVADHLGVALNSVQRWELGTSEPRGLYLTAVERFLAGE